MTTTVRSIFFTLTPNKLVLAEVYRDLNIISRVPLRKKVEKGCTKGSKNIELYYEPHASFLLDVNLCHLAPAVMTFLTLGLKCALLYLKGHPPLFLRRHCTYPEGPEYGNQILGQHH